MEIEEGVIRRGPRPRRITPSEISIVLHMIRKPNSITVLLVIQTISTQSSSAHVKERDQELWGTLEQDLSLIGFSKKQ